MVKYQDCLYLFTDKHPEVDKHVLILACGFLPSSCLFAGLTYMALRGKPGSPGMGKFVMPRVYISFSPWLLELHCRATYPNGNSLCFLVTYLNIYLSNSLLQVMKLH